MHAVEVGKPYLPGRTSLAAGVKYNFRAGQHELLLSFHDPSPSKVEAVRSGEAEFALVLYRTVIFFLYRFGEAIRWSDAPYNWHRVPAKQRVIPQLPLPASRALLTVILVDAGSNIVRALRTIAFSPEFSRALHAAIAEQAASDWSAESYDRDVHHAYDRWPCGESMLAAAVARTKGGE